MVKAGEIGGVLDTIMMRLAEFREKAAGPVAAKWIEENTARGLPAQELYDLVLSTLAN